MKKKIKLKKWVKVVILILVILVASILTTTHHRKTTIKNNATKVESKNKKQIIKSKNTIKIKAKEPVQEENAQNNEEIVQNNEENAQNNEEIVQNTEETHNEVQNTVQNQAEQSSTEQTTYETRMTSYYPNDGPGTGSITGSGLGPNDFEINEHGWYTYQGKLVVATATDYLISRFGLADGVRTYRYGDEITLNIDGVDYQAVVKDSCGNCMRTGRIDLFVSGSWAVKDTVITVKE